MLAAHGLDVTRSFCFWPDFVPHPETIDEDVAARFGDFLDAHVEAGMRTIPTFLVGHMSGENWDPAWRQGRDLHRDVWMVSQQAWFAAEIARRFGDHPAICGWLVSNEMPLYGGPGSVEEITAWARIVVQAVRSTGVAPPHLARRRRLGHRGDGRGQRVLAPAGSRRSSTSSGRTRTRCRTTSCASCSPPRSRASWRAASGSPSSSRSSASRPTSRPTRTPPRTTGRCCTRPCSPAPAAGSPGTTPTTTACATRTRIATTSSSSTSASRTRPGARSRRSRRCASSRPSSASCPEGWEPERRGAAIVVPEHFERELPFTDPAYRRDIRDQLLQSYVASREADLPVGLVRELDGLETDARLLIAPCAKLLTGPGIDRLRSLVHDGATLYLSYFAGSTTNQRGPWLSWLPELFGVEHRLRYGLVDPIEDDEVVLELVVGPRRAHDGDAPLLHGLRRAVGARAPPGRARGRRHRRDRQLRPTGAPSPPRRRRPDRPLHVSPRAHGGPDTLGEPREHVAHLLGAGRPRRRRAPRAGRRPAGSRRSRPGRRTRRRACSSTAPRPPSRSSRSTNTTTGDGTSWPLVLAPRGAAAFGLARPAADGDGRHEPITLALAASPLTKGGMPTSDLRPTHDAT